MNLKHEINEIIKWNELIQQGIKHPISRPEFCKENNIDYKKFNNMHRRIIYISERDPKLYKKLEPLARQCMSSELSCREFAHKHNLDLRIFSEMITHLRYRDIIENHKKELEQPSMNFIQVPTRLPERIPQQEVEVIEPKNSIELVISKGVKVTVSPEVSSEKLIKIIDLLKDL